MKVCNVVRISYIPRTTQIRRLYPNLIKEVEHQDAVLPDGAYILSADALHEWELYKEHFEIYK